MRRTELKRAGKPLRRSPLKRSTKPLRSKPSTLAKERRLRQDVLARDGGCVAIWYTPVADHEGSLDVAHVFPRRYFAAKDVYNPDACALLCRRHHRAYDLRENVTVPIAHHQRATDLLANAKIKPTRKAKL